MLRWILLPFTLLAGAALAALALLGIALILAYPRLPSIDALTDYRPKIPLRVYTADGHLIGEFGEERRHFVRIQDVPETMKQAILAAEDERFYQHPGVDTLGILRAAYSNFIGGGKRQGASTITMQVARNFFLSSEKTLTRKLYEAMLAFKIENSLSKDEILQIYINQIYLGQRAYGFSSAARIYFGKELKELSIAETAMLAGLPKAPSAYNPVANPKRAQLRQQYVLRRMQQLGFIDAGQFTLARDQPLHVRRQIDNFAVKADYAAEMARQIAVAAFPDEIYSAGLQVVTTLTRKEQLAAYRSLRQAVLDYDRRHGYRGAEAYVDMKAVKRDDDDLIDELLYDFEDADDLRLALVLDANPEKLRAYLPGGEIVTVEGAGLKFAQRMLDAKAPANKRLRRGAIMRLTQDSKGRWQVAQWPEVEAAFVAANPNDGAVRALVGGFDFSRNKFNHVTQAWRQPGSSFKPFIYSAALEKGYTPLSVLPDEPLSVSAEETGSQAWEPKNYDGKYDGPMTLRTALAKSKNMVSIRLIRAITPQYAQDYASRFGFDADKNPPYLTLALGAGAVTPWQQLTAYAVFANGGYKIEPFIVKQILDANGKVLAETTPVLAGDESLRIIDARNAWVMDSMMKDVVRRGTATRAQSLKRTDLAGKTGTTNDYVDAWFCGYQPAMVGVAWIGFDQPKRLGNGETGGSAALPIWIGYMETALKDVPEMHREAPAGLTRVESRDPASGAAIHDLIYAESIPAPAPAADREFSLPEFLRPSPQPSQPPAPVQEAQIKPVAPDRRVPMPPTSNPAEASRPPAR
ncbi:MAG: penicillin-binding protein 1A [Rhodocyclaceae bacterium]|nr:penicillin-binding protein 1A [Rhodocyclaceae bacterium]